MSKKDFNQGVQSGLKISEELLKKETKAMEYLKNKIDGMSMIQEEVKNAVNNILEFQTKEALEKYYGICNALSPRDLQEAERKVLLDILSSLAFQINNFNKAQKMYLSNLKHFLELVEYNPNVNYNFNLIDNIRDLDSQEIILKCIREFMFLENEDFCFVDSMDEILECFSIKLKIINKIDDCISITYYLFGKEGIIEMYGSHDVDGILFNETDDMINVELEEFILEGNIVINKGEEKKYENKIIRFNCSIECYGKIIFESCKLLYDKSNTIKMYENSRLVINNSFIKGIIKNERYEWFINAVSSNVLINISNSIIKDSNWFVCSPYESECYINSCEIINCNTLMEIGLAGRNNNLSVIQDCSIKYEEIIDKNHVLYSEYDKFLVKGEKIDIINSKFEGNNCFDYRTNDTGCSIIDGKINIIQNCSFSKISPDIRAEQIKLCRFDECCNVVTVPFLSEVTEIRDCVFYKCKDVIDSSIYSVKVNNCQFLECENKLLRLNNDSIVKNCQFYNIKGEKVVSIEMQTNNKHVGSFIENCTFSGINMNNAYLIGAKSFENTDSTILHIYNCKVEHAKVTNKMGKLVEDTYRYYGLFNKCYEKIGVSFRDCSGFDSITDIDGVIKDYTINIKNKNGELIGSYENIKEGIGGKVANGIYMGLATVKK